MINVLYGMVEKDKNKRIQSIPQILLLLSNGYEEQKLNPIIIPVNNVQQPIQDTNRATIKVSKNKGFKILLGISIVVVSIILFFILIQKNNSSNSITNNIKTQTDNNIESKNNEDQRSWVIVKNSQDPGKIREFITNYPQSIYLGEAETLLKTLSNISDEEIKAFVERTLQYSSSKDVSSILNCYDNYVNYFKLGTVSKNVISKDKYSFYKNWDVVHYSLIYNSLNINDIPDFSKVVVFEINYSAYSTLKNKTSEGIAESTFKIHRIGDELKIYDEKQRIISRVAK
jgi:hypothetical protein